MTLDDVLDTLQLRLYNPAQANVPPIFFFLLALLFAILVGRYTPAIVRLLINRLGAGEGGKISEQLIDPIKGSFKAAGTFLLISLSMVWLQQDYPGLHAFFNPFVDLATIISVAWLISRLFRQFVRVYGIEMLRRLGREVDEMLLVLETVANVVIGFLAVLAFAQSTNFNLVGLIASLGIGGIAVGLGAQQILEQLLSTIVLYLDRPFVPGEYIRQRDGQLCRVESIGLRSTKIRTAAKSTLIIVPNSKLVNEEIENVSRAKKVMVLLYMDFARTLTEEDAALIKQVVNQSTASLFGIDPGSTSVNFTPLPKTENNGQFASNRARVTFFILGSNENSIQLRKRLLELANDKMAEELASYGLEFTIQEPTVYVESPVTL